MLLSTPDLKKKWSYSVEWLHDELDRVSAARSALRLRKCSLINRKLSYSVRMAATINIPTTTGRPRRTRTKRRTATSWSGHTRPTELCRKPWSCAPKTYDKRIHAVLSFDLNGTLFMMFYLCRAGVGGSGGRSSAAERSERGRESLAPHAAAQLAATAGRR